MTSISSEYPATRSHPLAMQWGYSAANLGKSVVWTSFESIMLFYLVSIAGFGPLAAAALLAMALLWDGLFDLLIARWTDRRGSADGLAKLVLVGAPLCGVGFWLVFVLQGPWAIAAAVIACRVGYSLCDVGHNTLLIRVARAPGDAARVSGFRLLFSAGGVALLALASGSSLSLVGAEAQRQSFATGAMVGGTLYIATLFGALFATHGLMPPGSTTGERRVASLRHYWDNLPFRRLLFLIAIQAALVPLFQRALPFYGKAVHADPSWAGPALMTVTVAQSVALPMWMALSRRLAPRTISMASHAMTVAAMAGLAIAPIGLTGRVMLVGFGVAMGGMNLAIWALLTQAVHRSMSDGMGDEATPVGLFLGILKGAAAFGNLLFGAIVSVSASGMAGGLIPLSATLLPIVGSVAALCLLSFRWDGGSSR